MRDQIDEEWRRELSPHRAGRKLRDGVIEEPDAETVDPTDYGTRWIATLQGPEGNLIQLLEPLT